jgi:uncharacterized CHY-type Zn-finger protein
MVTFILHYSLNKEVFIHCRICDKFYPCRYCHDEYFEEKFKFEKIKHNKNIPDI